MVMKGGVIVILYLPRDNWDGLCTRDFFVVWSVRDTLINTLFIVMSYYSWM